MTEQLTLDGGSRILGLTDRQSMILHAIEHAEGGLAADEVGALLHQARGKHDRGVRCTFCTADGRAMLGGLRTHHLVVRRRSGMWESVRPLEERGGVDLSSADPSEHLASSFGPRSSSGPVEANPETGVDKAAPEQDWQNGTVPW